jgi:hypothetical protein
MSLAELIQNKTKNLKKNEEGIVVRTKEGLLFREKIVDGIMIREEIGKKVVFPSNSEYNNIRNSFQLKLHPIQRCAK